METVPVAADVVHGQLGFWVCAAPCRTPTAGGLCSPRLGCSLWLVLLPMSLQGWLVKGSFLQQKWGAAGREQSRHPCTMSPNVTHGDWRVETKTQRVLQGGKKIKGIEMK